MTCFNCSHDDSWHRPRKQGPGDPIICMRASCRCGKPPKGISESRRRITVLDPGQHPWAVSMERAKQIQLELFLYVWC